MPFSKGTRHATPRPKPNHLAPKTGFWCHPVQGFCARTFSVPL
jgi:hypothetical protein